MNLTSTLIFFLESLLSWLPWEINPCLLDLSLSLILLKHHFSKAHAISGVDRRHRGRILSHLNHMEDVCSPPNPSRHCATPTLGRTSVLIQQIYQTAVRSQGRCFKLAAEAESDGGRLDKRAVTDKGRRLLTEVTMRQKLWQKMSQRSICSRKVLKIFWKSPCVLCKKYDKLKITFHF